MELNDYIALSKSTDISVGGYGGAVRNRFSIHSMRLLHASLGLSSEVDELGRVLLPAIQGRDRIEGAALVNLCEEIGDLAWYWALLTREAPFYCDGTEIGEDMSFASEAAFSRTGQVIRHNVRHSASVVLFSITGSTSRLADHVKRHLFYGAPIRLEPHVQAVMTSIVRLVEFAKGMNDDVTLENILRANLLKLSRRFPDSFSEESALVRDLQAETATLAEVLKIQV